MEYPLIARILQYVRDNPGVPGSDVRKEFLPMSTHNAISSTLSRLRVMKLIENKGPGGPWSKWYPVARESVDEEFVDMAQWLIREMKELPPSERGHWLACRLQELG
jgi:hypothetical protein